MKKFIDTNKLYCKFNIYDYFYKKSFSLNYDRYIETSNTAFDCNNLNNKSLIEDKLIRYLNNWIIDIRIQNLFKWQNITSIEVVYNTYNSDDKEIINSALTNERSLFKLYNDGEYDSSKYHLIKHVYDLDFYFGGYRIYLVETPLIKYFHIVLNKLSNLIYAIKYKKGLSLF